MAWSHSSNQRRFMRIDIRVWTAIVIIGMCGFAVARGWDIVHFSLAMQNIDSSERRAEVAQAWRAVTGVAATALQSELTADIDPFDTDAVKSRHQALSEMLSIKPLASYDWLLLSIMQLAMDQPIEQVLESLELSMLTGPNEGHVMAKRGIFAVSLWESLLPDLKGRAARDMGPMFSPRDPEENMESEKVRAVLATKPGWVRNELRGALLATGLSPKEIDQRLGS
jgi:hypothetical protein